MFHKKTNQIDRLINQLEIEIQQFNEIALRIFEIENTINTIPLTRPKLNALLNEKTRLEERLKSSNHQQHITQLRNQIVALRKDGHAANTDPESPSFLLK